MSRDGLTEENLHDGSSVNISSRNRDGPTGFDKNRGNPESFEDHRGGSTRFDRNRGKSRSFEENPEGSTRKRKLRQNSTHNVENGTGEAAESDRFRRKSTQKNFSQLKSTRNDGKGQEDSDRTGSYRKKLRQHEFSPAGSGLSDQKKKIQKKQIKRKLTEEQAKRGRLQFDGEQSGMVKGAGAGIERKAAGAAAGIAAQGASAYAKASDEDKDTAEALTETGEETAAATARSLKNAQVRNARERNRQSRGNRLQDEQLRNKRTNAKSAGREFEPDGPGGSRLQFTAPEGSSKAEEALRAAQKKEEKARRNRFFQKRRYKAAYRAARDKVVSGSLGGAASVGGIENITVKAKIAVKEAMVKSRAVFIALGLFGLLFLIVAVSLSSCAASIQGGSSAIQITTYPESDDDIYAAENAYKALEAALQQQILAMQSTHPEYDGYNYSVDEITHNPYHLISFLTAKYGDWTYDDIKGDLQALFSAQYGISTEGKTETVTETKTIRVGDSLGSVVTSGYCNCVICCGQWSGGPTASGVYPTANHTIAVDASNPFVPIGTKVVMNGVEYTVEDTGAFARYGVQFDVYYDDHATAQAHGHQTWEAYLADDNGANEVTVTTTSTKDNFYVTVSNTGFDAVARANLTDEQLIIYEALNKTLGNRDYLWDLTTISNGGGGMSYEIPPEALTDERFARMIAEAEKYLGYPYVWGGSSPSESFDCSGFVCWVINNCGNGWSVGRDTAEGLRNQLTYVSLSEAKPGDIIFFQNTYATEGASHVGIYVGNNMMIHCGNPIQYANIGSAYWQEHFMCFGRLP